MSMKLLTKKDYAVNLWSGGTTRQLYIYPENASYSDREFLFRISSATVELPESTFTSLPDYNRLISTISGELDISHNGGSFIHLMPYQVHRFDGADETLSKGKCTDFNLMMRKGKVSGNIKSFETNANSFENTVISDPNSIIFIYCTNGKLSVAGSNEILDVLSDESVICKCENKLTINSYTESKYFLLIINHL